MSAPQNTVEFDATCFTCHRATRLACYDVESVLGGKKRVVNACPLCKAKLELTWDDWEALRARIDDTARAFAEKPDEHDRAVRALAAHTGLQDILGFRALAAQIDPRAEDHPALLSGLIYLYRALGEPAPVERLFARAVAAKPDDEEWHERFAHILMDYGYRDEVGPHLEHIRRRGVPDKLDLVLRLAQLHQAAGEHRAALRWFEVSEHVDPRLSESEEFRAVKAASETRQNYRERVDSGRVLLQLRQRKQWARALRVAPVVLGLLVAAYAAVAAGRGAARKVWFVNGLATAYRVTVNGAAYELPPRQATLVTLAEGPLAVIAQGPAAALGDQSTSLVTSFWSRPFDSTVYVVNPDRCAVLCRTHAVYGVDDPSYQVRRDWSGGELLRAFGDVDHAFEPPPDRVTVSGDHRRLTVRVVLSVVAPEQLAAADLLGAVRAGMGDAGFLALVERWVQLSGISSNTGQLLAEACKPEERVRLLERGLDRRPLDMVQHRAYQDALEDAGREAECAARYRDLAAQAPADLALAYLAARAANDPDRWLETLTRLAGDPAAPPQALDSYVGALLGRGRFADAIAPARRVVARRDADPGDHYQLWLALAGAGRTDEALAYLEKTEGLEVYTRLYERCLTLAATGREAAGKALARSRTGQDSLEDSHQLITHLDAMMAYAAGREDEAGTVLMKEHNPHVKAQGALMLGSPANAASALGTEGTALEWLSVFLNLHRLGKGGDPLAATALARASEALRRGNGAGGRAAAVALRGPSPVPAARLVALYVPLDTKPALLAALGIVHPEDRAVYFDMSRRLNVRYEPPHNAVKALTEGAR